MDWIMVFHLVTESPNAGGVQQHSRQLYEREAVHRRAQGDEGGI
jgi:hypothetical protein